MCDMEGSCPMEGHYAPGCLNTKEGPTQRDVTLVAIMEQRDAQAVFFGRTERAGLPMTHSLRVFDTLEPTFTPFKFVLCMELTL